MKVVITSSGCLLPGNTIKDVAACPKYSMVFSHRFLQEQNSLVTEVTFLANNKPVHIIEREMRKLLFRVINHSNAARRLGVFLVEPETGLLRFRQTTLTIGFSNTEIARSAVLALSQLPQHLEKSLMKIV